MRGFYYIKWEMDNKKAKRAFEGESSNQIISTPYICAIHQPNFFPWLGYFAKIEAADRFIFLDDVQIIKTGGSWTNRVYMQIADAKSWVSAPILREHGSQLILDTQFNEIEPWRKKIKKTLEVNYAKAPHFASQKSAVFALLDQDKSSVADFNVSCIQQMCTILGIEWKSKTVRSSELAIQSVGTQRLVDICKNQKCGIYLCGAGSGEYLEEKIFQEQRVELRFFNFKHPVYEQKKEKEFMAGLSILDALFFCGPDRTAELLTNIPN
jgi:hypothetical protein